MGESILDHFRNEYGLSPAALTAASERVLTLSIAPP
jgi:hypothetical protein